jgi:purine nucleosidase/pyrimidine-specific ribonucleoside hydrolase
MPTEPASRLPRRVIIDTDPGIDDALALALALRSPELRVEAITTVCGNVHVDLCTRNALLVLQALGVDHPPPVAQGADRPLQRRPVNASHVHGEDGLGGITAIVEPGGNPRYPAPRATACKQHAVDVILDVVKKNPDQITLIAVGPLTNVALALQRDRAAMSRLAALILMGGSLSGIGNVTPTAEFNFHADPHAARQVLRAGLKTTLVGLDVTHKTLLRKADLESHAARSRSPAARLVADVVGHYFTIAEARSGDAACPLHDPLAVGAAIDPSFVQTETFEADVETDGTLTAGMLVADRRRTNAPSGLQGRIQGCIEVNADRFVKFFLDRVLPPS